MARRVPSAPEEGQADLPVQTVEEADAEGRLWPGPVRGGRMRPHRPGGPLMPKTIKAAVITQRDGAHLPDYFGSLAKIDEAESVALVDPSGKSEAAARKTLGAKFHKAYKDRAA